MKPDKVVAAFDRLATRYDAWYTTPLGAFVDAREKAAVFALAGVRAGEQALDVGCGTGNYTLELARRLEQGSRGAGEQGSGGAGERRRIASAPPHPGSSAHVVGVDPSPAMLAIAMRKAQESGLPVVFTQAVAEALPFPAGSFDLAISVTALEFVTGPERAVAEMVRVLRPGGRLVVGVLNAWSLWAWFYRRQKGSVFEHAHFFSPPELLRLLRSHGRVTWSSCVFVPPWHSGRIDPPALALERIGSRWLRLFGAFLVARVR